MHTDDSRVVLITGAGSGIGRTTAHAFAAQGARVIVADLDLAGAEQTVSAIRAAGGDATAETVDITVEDQVRELLEGIGSRYGGLSAAINCAGIVGPGAIADEIDAESFAQVLAVDLTGLWLSMKYEIKQMKGAGGAIVNVASTIGAHMTIPGLGAYAAAKAAVTALTRTAAQEYVGQGIRINAVSPGPVATALSLLPGETPDQRADRLRGALPIGRAATTEEVAAAIIWLASEAASYAVGLDLVLDGGASI